MPGLRPAAVAVAVSAGCQVASGRPAPYAAVQEALADQRPSRFRLSGSRGHAACPPGADSNTAIVVRCAGPLPDRVLEDLSRLAATLSGDRSPPEEALRAAAVLELATSTQRPAAFERAVGRLEDAAAAHPSDPVALNDAAVALLLRGDRRDDARDLLRAAALLERAARAVPGSAVVAFNQALALQSLALSGQAAAAWGRFLALAPSREWAREAEAARAQLADAAPPDDAQWVRERIIDSLLPAWGRRLLAGDERGAAASLARALLLADSLSSESGDSSALEAALAASPQSAPANRRRLALGLVRYDSGRTLFQANRFEQASRPLNDAAALLEDAPALAGWPQLYVGAVAIYQQRYRRAEAAYRGVLEAPGYRRRLSLSGRAAWGLGLLTARQSQARRSLDWFSAAAWYFHAAGERLNAAAIELQQGQAALGLGQDKLAANLQVRAVRALGRVPSSPYLHTSRLVLGRKCLDAGLPELAVRIFAEVVQVARRLSDDKRLTEGLAHLARAEALAGQDDSARVHLAEARRRLDRLESAVMSDRMRTDIADASVLLLADRAPDSALALLSAAITFFERQNTDANLLPLLVQRARLQLRQGDTAGAEADLRTVVARVELRAGTLPAPSARRALLTANRAAYHELLGMRLARGDTLEAFAMAAAAVRGDAGAPARVPAPADVPPGVVVLSYTVLADRLLLWCLSSGGLTLHQRAIGADSLAGLVRRFGSLLRRGEDAARIDAASSALHALLVAPASPVLRGARTVAVVAEPEVAALPFAALRPGPRGRYLVEDVAIRFGASVGHAARAGRPGGPAAGAAVLLAGEPSMSRPDSLELGPLPAAAGELRAIAGLYRRAVVLQGSAATAARLERALAGPRLFHFAGHARSVELDPAGSHLVLAVDSASSGRGRLFGDQIRRLRLAGLRLAILSACATIGESDNSSGGLGGLAEAFLDAGAGGVIGSPWEVNDAGAATLMEELHRRLLAGAAPEAALQAAQLRLRNGDPTERSPRVWAAFRYQES